MSLASQRSESDASITTRDRSARFAAVGKGQPRNFRSPSPCYPKRYCHSDHRVDGSEYFLVALRRTRCVKTKPHHETSDLSRSLHGVVKPVQNDPSSEPGACDCKINHQQFSRAGPVKIVKTFRAGEATSSHGFRGKG